MQIDFTSGLWLGIKRLLEEQLQDLRVQNDSQSLGPEQTASIRGEIKRIKILLDLPNAAAREAAVPVDE